MAKLFGTDGVRGLANIELTPELAFSLGRAGAHALTKEARHAPQIIIGRDTRISGGMLEAALAAGACSVGARVLRAGVLPTPGIAFLVGKYKLDAGVMITASHNLMEDNGIKFFSRQGYKLPDSMEEEIESLIESGLSGLPRPSGDQVGAISDAENATADYVEFLKSTFLDEGDLSLKGLKVAVDCANGAGFKAGPAVFESLGAEVFPLFNNPDGSNINKGCGSTRIQALAEFVPKNGMDIGIALDGDGDRLLCVDEAGCVVDGDQVMSICGYRLKKLGKLKKDAIVATIMSNIGLSAISGHGIKLEKTNVGDRYVLERMLEIGASFGGEQSGHVIFLDYCNTGDGLLTALQLLKGMVQANLPLSKLNSIIRIFPQVTLNAKIKQENKAVYQDDPAIAKALEALEDKYRNAGRVLVRASGTESVVRVMIEGEDKAELEKDASKIVSLLEELLG